MEPAPLPHRVQRRRIKGYRLPPGTVSVTRPGKWGNPFRIGVSYQDFAWLAVLLPDYETLKKYRDAGGLICETVEQTLEMFEAHLRKSIELYPGRFDLSELRGKNLACYCRLGEPCHADILLKYANQQP